MEEHIKELAESLEEAREAQKALNLESVDTAILLMIYQVLDTIRFNQ